MNDNLFETKVKKSNKGKALIFMVILVVIVIVFAIVFAKANLSSVEKTEDVVTENDAVILNDIPSLGCVTLYCGQYTKLGYEVSYYQSGTDFKPGMYTFEMKFEDTTEDNQYMIVQTTNNDSIKYEYGDGRLFSIDFFGGTPAHEEIVIHNIPLVKDSDFEVMYKNGFKDTAKLIPQSGYIPASVSGISDSGYYPVGEGIEAGTYEISYIRDEGIPLYSILNETNKSNDSGEESTFTLDEGDTLVLSQRCKLTKIED